MTASWIVINIVTSFFPSTLDTKGDYFSWTHNHLSSSISLLSLLLVNSFSPLSPCHRQMFLNSVILKKVLGYNSNYLDRHEGLPCLITLMYQTNHSLCSLGTVWVQSFCNFCTLSWIFSCVNVKSYHISSSCIRNLKNLYVPLIWLQRIIAFEFDFTLKWAAPFVKAQIPTTFIALFKIFMHHVNKWPYFEQWVMKRVIVWQI